MASDAYKLYRAWNSALLKYFFPNGDENPIIYIDENVLKQVATKSSLDKGQNTSFSEFLLSSTLLNNDSISTISFEWDNWNPGKTNFAAECAKIKGGKSKWDKFVSELTKLRFLASKEPAYFAELCAIMLLASQSDAIHANINSEAQAYLGKSYAGKPGELVDSLLQQLHLDFKNFNPNRMLRGTQKHISKIKYHLALKKTDRSDFIDFLEVNNLKWEYETYEFFVNNILIPALGRANKTELVKFVTQEENISYVKNILTSNLDFGKETSVNNNILQEKEVKWYFVLYFDFCGNPSFHIKSDYSLPFCLGLDMESNKFTIQDEAPFLNYIATNVSFNTRLSNSINYKGSIYNVCNICGNSFNKIYFEKIDDSFYKQVEIPQNGKCYYVLLKENLVNTINEPTWTRIDDLQIDGYVVFEANNYVVPQKDKKVKTVVTDKYGLFGVGTWFCINLSENQSLHWIPNKIGANEEEISKTLIGKDGKTYFRLRPTNRHLSGDIIIKEKGKVVMTEQIILDIKWNGDNSFYHMNGWGEIVKDLSTENINEGNSSSTKLIRQYRTEEKLENHMLIQTLYDIADENGCLSSQKMTAAINFVFNFFGIPSSDKSRESVIYALRRLGYTIAYYDIDKRDYINQLVSSYLSRCNYSIDSTNQAYFVKGIYSLDDIAVFNKENIYRERPYGDMISSKRPEYICLPDIILYNRKDTNWKKIECTTSDLMISNMENISGFERKYLNDMYGDQYDGIISDSCPCMVKTMNGHEVLCLNKSGKHYIYKYYDDNTHRRFIPKHIARSYTQYKKDMHVCLMMKRGSDVDYSKVQFISGMGLPEVLDIALCDLNLKLPEYKHVFIVNEADYGFKDSEPITEIKTYNTTATQFNHTKLTEALVKLSGRNINNSYINSGSVIFTYSINHDYYIKFSKLHSNIHYLRLYNRHNILLAFSIGKKLYYDASEKDGKYRLVHNDISSLNTIYSSIINRSTKDFTYGETFSGKMPELKSNNEETIIIIEHN